VQSGVGISGLEGMQAAMASDFTIAQFRFLAPLLLVHGRLSYKRITRMICFFFYKNLLYGSTIFVYNAFALFSGQPIYNDFYMTLFNVVFTAAAPLVVGWFDRDLDKNAGLQYPFLYKEGACVARWRCCCCCWGAVCGFAAAWDMPVLFEAVQAEHLYAPGCLGSCSPCCHHFFVTESGVC
jgi:magnesium-transporting ATPase (P-type)